MIVVKLLINIVDAALAVQMTFVLLIEDAAVAFIV